MDRIDRLLAHILSTGFVYALVPSSKALYGMICATVLLLTQFEEIWQSLPLLLGDYTG